MPTTLITTVQGIGLGVMGQALAEHVPEIDRIVGVRRMPEQEIDLAFPERRFEVHDRQIPLSALKDDRKVLYIEQSYGLASRLEAEKIYVPMWEQESTRTEVQHATRIVSVTRHTETEVQRMTATLKHPPLHEYLPWPVATDVPVRQVSSLKTILHNAGSLGGHLRKGTDQAIKIFQTSHLAEKGVRLVIHSFMPCPPDLKAEILAAPAGIEWTGKFLDRAEDIYDRAAPDLLLFPSKIEGHALVVMEAMARGIPVLATDSPPINAYDFDPRFLMPVERYAPSPLLAPYALVNVTYGAERLRALEHRPNVLAHQSLVVRDHMLTHYSWAVLRDSWRALCA